VKNKNKLTIKKFQFDFNCHLNGQDFWSQLVQTQMTIKQPKSNPKSEEKKT
jgi:hypothetical protein